jgi:hemerythrin superfamily protein
MNAIDLLTGQHRAMEAEMQALIDADKDSARERLLAAVGDALTAHIASEEKIFYPAVRARATEGILLESLEEHLSLKRLLADLLALKPSDPTFEAKFKVLAEQAEHHHEEEEEHLFPKVRRMMEDDELDSLGLDMTELQDQLLSTRRPRDAVRGETLHAAPL